MVCEVPPDRPLLTAQEPATEPNKDLAMIERDKDFLFQLPPSYHYTPARLKTIVSQLDSGRRNVVEFRHSSWWNEKVYSAFKAHGVIFCSFTEAIAEHPELIRKYLGSVVPTLG